MTPAPAAAGMRLIRWLGAAGLVIFAVAAFSPLANRLNAWMAGAARLEPADAIVVLGRGGADADGVLTNRSLRRTLRGIDLYRERLAPILVFSGSSGETAARAELAQGFGVPVQAILRAPAATSTREEAARLRSLLDPRGIRRVLLVADPIDMPRARASMERAGFTVLPAPTAASGPGDPGSRLNLLREIAVELFGWLYYRLLGFL
jgi:uncharacterized SAM-binding protein YcdF (DUF218 family)